MKYAVAIFECVVLITITWLAMFYGAGIFKF